VRADFNGLWKKTRCREGEKSPSGRKRPLVETKGLGGRKRRVSWARLRIIYEGGDAEKEWLLRDRSSKRNRRGAESWEGGDAKLTSSGKRDRETRGRFGGFTFYIKVGRTCY